ncbi:hypothetical protein ACFGVR_01025 [Mucilaginibacter sp. AW1-3]
MPPDTGDGGDGFPPPGDPCSGPCQQEQADFFNETTQITADNTTQSITEDAPAPIDPNTRNRTYIWIFAESPIGLFKLKSTEHAIQKRASATDPWHFDSLTHFWAGITESLIVGGTMTLNMEDATPYVQPNVALMSLRFNTTSSFVCSGSPISVTTKDMNTYNYWYVDAPTQ